MACNAYPRGRCCYPWVRARKLHPGVVLDVFDLEADHRVLSHHLDRLTVAGVGVDRSILVDVAHVHDVRAITGVATNSTDSLAAQEALDFVSLERSDRGPPPPPPFTA